MRIIRSTAAAALVVATSLVGAGAWAHGNTGTTSGSTTTQQTQKGQTSQQGQTSATQKSTQKGTQKGVTEKQGTKKLSSADQKFFRDAYSDATAEAAIGELAARNGATAQVQQLGQKLAADSSRQLTDLKNLAQKNGVTLPSGMQASYQTQVTRLTKLHGPAFDRAFISHVRTREHRVLGEMQQEAKAGKNADLKSYASGEVAVVRGHVDQARSIGVTAPQKAPGKGVAAPQKKPSGQTPSGQPSQPKSNQNQGAWPQR